MNVLLVDDEMLALEKLEDTAREVMPDAELHSFQKAKAAMEFAASARIDVAFLDIDMRIINGVTMAKQLLEFNPNTNIVFCTGFPGYMPQAMELYCSDYILKPITVEKMTRALAHLRHPVEQTKAKVRIQCYGAFEVYYNESPVHFHYARTKELLAFLVHRNGTDVATSELMTELFELETHRSYFNKLRSDLLDTFAELGQTEVVRTNRGTMGINRNAVSCDYFDVRDGKRPEPKNVPYMEQYIF